MPIETLSPILAIALVLVAVGYGVILYRHAVALDDIGGWLRKLAWHAAEQAEAINRNADEVRGRLDKLESAPIPAGPMPTFGDRLNFLDWRLRCLERDLVGSGISQSDGPESGLIGEECGAEPV